MRIIVAVLAIMAWTNLAEASHGNDGNIMAGPILGLSHAPDGWRLQLGVEGGVGAGPERLNAGFEQRAGKLFTYLELDPWLLLGGSFGVGVDEDGDVHPVLGIWEGTPLRSYPCGNGSWIFMASLSVGIRYSGAWEIYAAPKAGGANPGCID